MKNLWNFPEKPNFIENGFLNYFFQLFMNQQTVEYLKK